MATTSATQAATTTTSGASGSNNPRKFSEKIALHKQKEAEEKAEFDKMMRELTAVKELTQNSSGTPSNASNSCAPRQQQQHNSSTIGFSTATGMISIGSGSALSGAVPNQHHMSQGGRHLSPPNFASAVPRHGSLPNVNAAMNLQVGGGIPSVLSSDEFPLVIEPGGISGPNIGSSGHLGRIASPTHGQGSVRDSIHGTGPIRSIKTRIDTSPYGSDRFSSSSYHLSPPDPTWRRVHSDSSIHQSVAAGGGGNVGGGGVTGGHHQMNHQVPVINQNGMMSPLNGASPTLLRRAPHSRHVQSSRPIPKDPGETQNMDHISSFLEPPCDGDISTHLNKPGSLPDLSNFHVNPANSVNNHCTNSSSNNHPDELGSPYSTSPVNTSPGTCGVGYSPGNTVPNSPRSPEMVSTNAVSAPINMASRRQCGSSGHSAATSPQQNVENCQQIFFPTSLVSGDSQAAINEILNQLQNSAAQLQLQHQEQQQQLLQSQNATSSSSSTCATSSSPNATAPLSSVSSCTTSSAISQRQSLHQINDSQTTPSINVLSSSLSSSNAPPVRFSNNEISQILSLPMNMVSDDSQHPTPSSKRAPTSPLPSPRPHILSPRSPPSLRNKGLFCDSNTTNSKTTNRNFLHMSKGLAIDASTGNSIDGGVIVFSTCNSTINPSQTLLEKSSNLETSTQSVSTYRNSQVIPSAHSPGSCTMQGSPSGRSTSPIDMIGSPHSPNTLNNNSCSPNQSPGVYDSMAGGGGSFGAQNTFAQNELSNEFQKFTMVENSSSGLYFPDGASPSLDPNPQPMSELANFLGSAEVKNNQLVGGNNHQNMAPQTPQTPSSIPDIILTDADDSSEQALQRALAMNFDSPTSGQQMPDILSPEISANFSDLGKLDDNMLRLLTDGVTMDQQIADAMTEEHLKL